MASETPIPVPPTEPAAAGNALRSAPFQTVLVANRGEIACRVIRTLRELGIRSVAVFSDADAGARHVREADVAVRIGPAAAASSYLDVDAVVAAAVATGAQAVHPGYGFLSENAAFARACAAAGIVFIGPGIDAIEVMGDKVRAKAHVGARGVPVIDGTEGTALSDAELAAAALRIGFPLLIKPSAGGGGKGMLVVNAEPELAGALASARRIALAAFGDDTLLLERLVPTPRHIEVQVLADRFGHVVHLGERECSLQRRHQKVIEEAPSPLLDDATRERIGLAACEVARSVGYEGAGTVEFLVSDADPTAFHFLEMNTRLQVEHPVTEFVTGVDIVAWQLRIAAGEPLTIGQADVRLAGHSIEARLYAEDPRRAFLPGAGTVLALAEPRAGAHVRVDSSLFAGAVVPADYDPMLAKVIVWGSDRAQALARLDSALAESVVLGVPTNLEYLRLLLADPAVIAGALDTSLIERRLPHLAFEDPDFAALAAAALVLREREIRPGRTGPGSSSADGLAPGSSSADRPRAGSPWARHTGWRLGEHCPSGYRLEGPAGTTHVEISRASESGAPETLRVIIGDRADTATITTIAPGRHLVRIGALSQTYLSAREPGPAHGGALWLARDGVAWRFHVPSRAVVVAESRAAARASLAGSAGAASPLVSSPMPGTIVAVHAADGDHVDAGDPVLSVEAMKMEHQVLAPISGTLSLAVVAGDVVRAGSTLATVLVETPAHVTAPVVSPMPSIAPTVHPATDIRAGRPNDRTPDSPKETA